MVSAAVVCGPARAEDDALRALGLGLSIINNLQQQQVQQQRQQQQQQPRRQPQATQQRQPRATAGQAQRPPAETAAARRQSETTRNVQAMLNRLGYDAGPVDGDPGPRTRTAIAAFRADYGLPPGTAVDPELIGALRVAGRDAPAAAGGARREAWGSGRGAPQAVNPPLWNEPEAPAPATVTMEGGIVMIDGRVAAMTDGRPGPVAEALGGADVGAGIRRLVLEYAVSFSPESLEEDGTALAALEVMEPEVAVGLFEEGLGRPLTQYQAREVRRGAVSSVTGGLNAFEEKRVAAAVRSNVDRFVRSDLPEPPVPLRVYCSLWLGEYVFETQSFPVDHSDCDEALRGAEDAEIAGAGVEPDRLPMAPEAAEAFQSERYRQQYLAAFDAQLDIQPGGAGGRLGPKLVLSGRTGLRLLAPGSATEILHDFGGPASGEGGGVLTSKDGILYVDGRMVAASTTSLSYGGNEMDVSILGDGMRRRLFSYHVGLSPDSALKEDDAAIEALKMLPTVSQVEVVEASLGRSLSDAEVREMQTLGSAIGRLVRSPFDRRRAAEGVRARAGEFVPDDLPELPLPVRVFCSVQLGEYDFDTGSFPVSRQDCDGGLAGAPVVVQASGNGAVPERIEVAPEEAEALAKLGGYDVDFLASFDAGVDVSVRRTESTEQLLVSLVDRHGLMLYPKYAPEQVVWRDPAAGAAVGKTATPRPAAMEPWVLRDEADQAEMAALAGAPKSFPADGAALIAAGGETLGLIDEPSRHLAREDGSLWPARLFDTYHVEARLRLATALSVPLEHVVELRGPTSGQGLGGIYGLLPAPAGSYSAMPPADLYGERDVRYRWTAAVTGLHAFDLPGGGGVLLAVLQPLEGRFITTDDRDPQVLESFDLTARVPPPEVELIVPESRAAIALAAAGDADAVELLIGMLDSRMSIFDREALAKQMVEAETGRREPLAGFWTEGELTFGEYDLKAEAFPVTSGRLGPVEVLRRADVATHAIFLNLDQGIAVRMGRDEARAWVEAHPDDRHRVRARFAIKKSSLYNGTAHFTGTLTEIDFLAPDAVVTRRDPREVLWRYETAAPAAVAARPETPAEPAPAAPPAPEPVTRDILGISLGAPLEEATATVTAEIVPTASYTASRDTIPDKTGVPDVLAWGSFATATLLHNEASRVSVALFSEPPAAADRVTAILRTQTFADAGRPHPDAIEDILLKKYGAPSERNTEMDFARILIWYGNPPGRGDCFRKQSGEARNAAIELHNAAVGRAGSRVHWNSIWHDATGTEWDVPDGQTMDMRKTFIRLADCEALGEVLIALVLADPDGMVRSLQLALAHPAEAGRLVEENEKAAQRAAPTGESGLEVKL